MEAATRRNRLLTQSEIEDANIGDCRTCYQAIGYAQRLASLVIDGEISIEAAKEKQKTTFENCLCALGIYLEDL